MSLSEREREIERTRERLSRTIDQIGDKLTFSGMVDEALGSGRLPVFEQSYGRALDVVRRNPLPVLLVAAGIGFVLTRMAKRDRGARLRLHDPALADLPVVNDGRARRYEPEIEPGEAEIGTVDGRRGASA